MAERDLCDFSLGNNYFCICVKKRHMGKGLKVCPSPILRNVVCWWEMLLHFNHFWTFPSLWTRKAAIGNRGCAGATPAAELTRRARGPNIISLPRLWLMGMQSAQKPQLCQAARERQVFPKLGCFVFVRHSIHSTPAPSIGSLPKQQSGRSTKGPYILHVIPCLNPSRWGAVNISLLLGHKGPRRAAGCGGSPCCPDRGQPPFRTSNTHSERLPQEGDVHPCSYQDPCHHTPKLYPPEGLYCSKPVALVPLVLCFILVRQWLSFSLSDCWNNSRVLASVRGLQ